MANDEATVVAKEAAPAPGWTVWGWGTFGDGWRAGRSAQSSELGAFPTREAACAATWAAAAKVVKKFKVSVIEVSEREIVYDVDAYNANEASLQAEHNAAILMVNGREKRGMKKVLKRKVVRVDEVR